MHMYVFLVPLVGWLSAVIIKTIVNFCYHHKYDLRLSFANGGFPSAHTSTVISASTYIGLYDGFTSTTFLLAECVSLIVITDATHLRRSISQHAAILNKLNGNHKLSEREGHTYLEVFGGFIVGIIVGYIFYCIL